MLDITCPACGQDTLDVVNSEYSPIQAPERLCGDPITDRWGDPYRATPPVVGQYPRTRVVCTGSARSRIEHVRNGAQDAIFKAVEPSVEALVFPCRYSGSLSPAEYQQLICQVALRSDGVIR